ncbi:MAG TPA: response regulator [Segetibacter sp.]|jgi:DNA-binding response OmpR family regulator
MIKILLAEDDRDDLDIFQLALEDLQQPFELRHAKNGEILLTLLNEDVPDFIFLDILMPRKNGLACIREIRKNEKFNSVPIIVITSAESEENIDYFYSNHVSFYLLKQCSIKDLTYKLKYIFSVNWKSLTYYPSKSNFVLD